MTRAHAVPVTLLAIAAAYAALFVHYLQATIIVQPFWDMFAHVVRYLDYREGGALWTYLWEPHVQHRHIWVRLLTALDVEAFGGVALPFVIASAACQGATAWLLWRAARLPSTPPGPGAADVRGLNLLLASAVVFIVLTSVSAVVCAIPMNSVYPQALMFAVLALVLFEGAPAGHGAVETASWRRAAALLAAAAAAFANAVALVLWPILAWMAWRGQAGWRWVAGVGITGAAFIAWYVHGLPLGPEGAVDPDRAQPYLRAVDYVALYMGLPWTRAPALAVPGRLIGGVLLVTAVWAMVSRGILRAHTTRRERTAVALIAFSVASAVLAAYGRAEVDADVTVPVRYSLFLTPLHAGLLLLAVPWLHRQWTVGAARRRIHTLAIGAGFLLLVQQVAAGQQAVATTRSMRATLERFVAGEQDEAMRSVVFDDLEEARAASDRIRAAKLYLR